MREMRGEVGSEKRRQSRSVRERIGLGQEGVNGVETGRVEEIKRSRGVICKEK